MRVGEQQGASPRRAARRRARPGAGRRGRSRGAARRRRAPTSWRAPRRSRAPTRRRRSGTTGWASRRPSPCRAAATCISASSRRRTRPARRTPRGATHGAAPASTGRPATSTSATVSTARGRSKPSDVARSKQQPVLQVLGDAGARHVGQPRREARVGGEERPEPQVEQEAVGDARDRGVRRQQPDLAAPAARGSSPAPRPIHAAPIIWNGSHGPTPPVTSAEANMPIAPRQKPKPGPSARPPRTTTIHIGSKPACPQPNGRSAAAAAASTPSSATPLASRPPSATSASTHGEHQRQQRGEQPGRVGGVRDERPSRSPRAAASRTP